MGNAALKSSNVSRISNSLWTRLSNKTRALRALVIHSKEPLKSDFPPEVIIEILSWLPLKSLVKLQLVCKEWRDIVRDHYFVEKHMNHSTVVRDYYNAKGPFESDKPLDERAAYLHGCDGLVVVKNLAKPPKYYIWNPAMRSVLELPDPHCDSCRLVISYIPTTRNYKVVSIYDDKNSGREGCEVFIPGESEAWRKLVFPDVVEGDGVRERQRISVVPTGATVHCVRVVKVGSDVFEEVVTLDMVMECFTVTPLPRGVFEDWRTVWALDWDEKLAFANLEGNCLKVMEFEDLKKGGSEQKKTIPLPFLKKEEIRAGDGNFYPLFAKDGAIWFWFKKEKTVIYTIGTGSLTNVRKSETFAIDNNLYPYKPSLLTFKGMQPDTKFQRLRPRMNGWSG